MPAPISIVGDESYFAVSPEGLEIEIPKELFSVLRDFTEGHKQNGTAVVQFRNGGVAGLETMIKKTYK